MPCNRRENDSADSSTYVQFARCVYASSHGTARSISPTNTAFWKTWSRVACNLSLWRTEITVTNTTETNMMREAKLNCSAAEGLEYEMNWVRQKNRQICCDKTEDQAMKYRNALVSHIHHKIVQVDERLN